MALPAHNSYYRTSNPSQDKLKEAVRFQTQQLGTMFYTLDNKSRYPIFEEHTKTLDTYILSDLLKEMFI